MNVQQCTGGYKKFSSQTEHLKRKLLFLFYSRSGRFSNSNEGKVYVEMSILFFTPVITHAHNFRWPSF